MFINNFGKYQNNNAFFQDIYREFFEERLYAFVSSDTNFISKPCKNIEEMIYLTNFSSHFSLSLYFNGKSRLKENLSYMLAIPIDIDWGKKGIKKTQAEVWAIVKEKMNLELTYIWNSKTDWCYHGCVLIEPMVGTPKSIHLFEWIAKEIARKINSDLASTNANQWLRIPKRNALRGANKYSNKIYNISELKYVLPSEEELKERKEKQVAQRDNVSSMTEYRILKHPAIKALTQGDITSWRNHACFTLALLYKALGKSQDEAENLILGDWLMKVNSLEHFDHPFYEKEAKSCIKSAFSKKYRGPSKEWIYNVTNIEFPWNINYVRTKYKKSDEVDNAILLFIKENEGITIKHGELAEKTGLTVDIVKKALPQMKRKSLIQYESIRGGNVKEHKGTTFYLGENANFLSQSTAVIEVDFGYRELNIEII